MRRLFLFRPEPGASASAERAKALGLAVVTAPLFRIVPLRWRVPDPAGFDALLLTSANAVRCAGTGLAALAGLPVHAVGDATAEAARGAGLEVATVGDSDVRRLLGAIPAELRLLHLCGEHRRSIGDARQAVTALPVYRAEAQPPPEELEQLAGNVAAVHSPRAASRLAELVARDRRASIRVAAISAAAAAAAGDGWECVAAAPAPADAALLALAARLCEECAE